MSEGKRETDGLMALWQYVRDLWKHAKLYSMLSAASTAVTFSPVHFELRTLFKIVAVVTFIAANFNLYRSQQATISQLLAKTSTAVTISIVSAVLRASANASGKTGLNVVLLLDIQNKLLPTTLRVKEIEIHGMSLDGEMLAFFHGPNISGQTAFLHTGFSASLRLSLQLVTSVPVSDVPSNVTGWVSLEETQTGLLPRITFSARREA